MSVRNAPAAVRHVLQDLFHTLDRLERRLGDDPDLLRLRADAEQLSAALAMPPGSPAKPSHEVPPELVTVSDAPYDPTLWRDAEDEGLGGPGRRAP